MLVVMHSHASPEQVEQVVAAIRAMKLSPHPMPGATRTAIGITGNIGAVDPRTLEVLPGVMELIRVTKPYKLASREMHEADTFVRLPQTVVGPGTFTLIAGPCSVENEAMILRTAAFLMRRGVRLMAAEYVMAGGNYQVILCERGVRTFSDHSRNTLDLSVIPPVKKLSHLPILVDPSHGTGKRDYVPPMALAALAGGADGLLLEIHPDPDHAQSDGAQTLNFPGFERLLESLKRLAGALERAIN